MKIAIEAQRIFRKKKGGMDVVAVETIKHLQKIDKENEYIIYAAPGDEKNYTISETSNFKIKFFKGFTYADWEQVWLPLQLLKDKPDILHCTSNTAPLIGSVPKVVTVHDIIYLEKKCWPVNSNLYQRFGNYYRSWVVPQVIKNAEQIVTVSQFEKKNISSYFSLDEWKVKVISNAANENFKRVEEKGLLDKVRRKYILPAQYILFLGNTEPRKNMRNLIKAYAILLKNNSKAPDLVITNISKDVLSKILSEINLVDIINKISLVGYVDCEDLPALYSLAEFFIYPSLREGFGLPLLESMACGTPVITSSVSSMPEIAGEAALLADPNNPESISDAMFTYLTNSSVKQEMIRLGYDRSLEFTWLQSAKNLLEVYYSLYEFKKASVLKVQYG